MNVVETELYTIMHDLKNISKKIEITNELLIQLINNTTNIRVSKYNNGLMIGKPYKK